MNKLTRTEFARLKNGVKCRLVPDKIENLADYVTITSSTHREEEPFWFRGHRVASWTLTPSALRYTSVKRRAAALELMQDFRRIAEIKLDRPPANDENLKWIQLAQHFGIPTRLLDWTESTIFALYFACILSSDHGDKK